MKVPNFKFQIPMKHQAPSSKKSERADLEVGLWNFSGTWNLEFGTWFL
jgi:hypothetical protein